MKRLCLLVVYFLTLVGMPWEAGAFNQEDLKKLKGLVDVEDWCEFSVRCDQR